MNGDAGDKPEMHAKVAVGGLSDIETVTAGKDRMRMEQIDSD